MDDLSIKDDGYDNTINVDSRTPMSKCKIHISGNGNVIIIGRNNQLNNLFINLKGNNKKIIIREGIRNINNLKIVSIRGDSQFISIGKNFSCGGLEIQMNDGDEKLTIGDDCLFSWGIKMRTSDGHSIIDLETNMAINLPKNINISERVWIGEDVKVLKGADLPPDTIVSSGAIVTKAFGTEDSHCRYSS